MAVKRSSNWGGKRPNTGRKRGSQPRVSLHFSKKEARTIWLLAKYRRTLTNNSDLTEEQLVMSWAEREWREVDQQYQETAEEAQEPYIL